MLKGNNSKIVRECLEERPWWIEMPISHNHNFNFKWSPISQGIKFELMSSITTTHNKQLVNHFEYHRELSRKSNLFKNLQTFGEIHHENIFNFIPLTFFVEINPEKSQSSLNSALHEFSCIYNIFDEYKERLKEGSDDPAKMAMELGARPSLLGGNNVRSPIMGGKGSKGKQKNNWNNISLYEKRFDKYSITNNYTIPLCHFNGIIYIYI